MELRPTSHNTAQAFLIFTPIFLGYSRTVDKRQFPEKSGNVAKFGMASSFQHAVTHKTKWETLSHPQSVSVAGGAGTRRVAWIHDTYALRGRESVSEDNSSQTLQHYRKIRPHFLWGRTPHPSNSPSRIEISLTPPHGKSCSPLLDFYSEHIPRPSRIEVSLTSATRPALVPVLGFLFGLLPSPPISCSE